MEPLIGRRDEVGPVTEHDLHARIVERAPAEVREVGPGEIDDTGVELCDRHVLDRRVLENLLDEAAVAAPDDPDVAGRTVGKNRHVGQHLVVDEFVGHRQLGHAIEREHPPESLAFGDDEMLMLGLAVEQHPIYLDRHPDVVVQRLGQPRLVRLHLRSVPRRGGSACANKPTATSRGCREVSGRDCHRSCGPTSSARAARWRARSGIRGRDVRVEAETVRGIDGAA